MIASSNINTCNHIICDHVRKKIQKTWGGKEKRNYSIFCHFWCFFILFAFSKSQIIKISFPVYYADKQCIIMHVKVKLKNFIFCKRNYFRRNISYQLRENTILTIKRLISIIFCRVYQRYHQFILHILLVFFLLFKVFKSPFLSPTYSLTYTRCTV